MSIERAPDPRSMKIPGGAPREALTVLPDGGLTFEMVRLLEVGAASSQAVRPQVAIRM
jgi:hypothetical protein